MTLRKIDCHVHLVGDGSSGSHCWIKLSTIKDRLLARLMIKGVGLPASSLKSGLDALYVENLLQLVRESDLDEVVLLAQDLPYDDSGRPIEDGGQFYVPNEYVIGLAQSHSEFIPACSIHPGRPDAMEELERCIIAGVPMLKLLPNCLNVDYEDDRYGAFWHRMAEVGMILLSHTGGEMTVKEYDSRFSDPKKLAHVLDCGVTVIAAHAAGKSALFDPDWTKDLIGMFDDYPHLYADNSALCSFNRARTLKYILDRDIQSRIVHGSDFPVPVMGVMPWMSGYLSWRDYRRNRTQASDNILQYDYLLKKTIGFDDSVFTRMDKLFHAAKKRESK